jgi:hypothetical protein
MACLDGYRLCERLQRPLAGRVCATQRHHDPAGNARDEQQSPAAVGAHARQDRLGDPQCAHRVELEQPAYLGQRNAFRGCAQRLSGVADQRVKLPGGGERRVYRLLVGDIEGEPGRGRQVFQGGAAAGGRDDLVAARREFADGRPADALGRAGDEDTRHNHSR